MSVPSQPAVPGRTPGPERNTVRIFQTHNAAGTPAPAEYVRVIHHNSVITLGSEAMNFLAPLNPTQTEHPGVFRYTDPANGSGWLRLEEFATSDAARIQELVRMEEINRVAGKEPFRPADLAVGNALVLRSSNPWVLYTLAFFSISGGVGALTTPFRSPFGIGETIAIVVMSVLLIGVGVLLAVRSTIQLRWWRKARQVARAQGGPMPSDLTGI
jgi:hypothetical protein